MDRFSAHLDRSWDLISRGETTQALVAARQALDIDVESPEVHNLLGYIHALQGDYDEALECYRQAIELDEWFLEPLLNAAELLAHPDADPAESVVLCRQAAELELSPEELADALLIEVDALINLGRLDEARVRLGSIEAGDALPVAYQVALGRALFDVGDPDAAQPFIDRAIEFDPTLPDAWYARGILSRDDGKRVDAVVAFLETRERDLAQPRLPWSRSPTELEDLARGVIRTLEPVARAQLADARVQVVDYPSEEQIRREVDPRQVVLLEGIDPARGGFEVLWIFTLNLERISGPAAPEEELRVYLLAELGAGAHENREV
jgi:tetratricopeptide (TPR) repeat protein